MRLTTYTDYSLRTLLYLALHRKELLTIQEIADFHQISKNHLTKVVHHLGKLGLIETVRGRHGGIRLGLDPSDINLGAVVRATETDFYMAECFQEGNTNCRYTSACTLQHILSTATSSFLQVLDSYTLDQLLHAPTGQPAVANLLFTK